jgi:ribosomal protein L37AE/L43A
MNKNSQNYCPKCGKDMIYKEYTADFYHLKGSACSTCGYFLVQEGWVDSIKMGKSFQPKATS